MKSIANAGNLILLKHIYRRIEVDFGKHLHSLIMYSSDPKQHRDDFSRRSEMIEKAITTFSAEFCETVVTPTDERFEVLWQRIDRCWMHHVNAARQAFEFTPPPPDYSDCAEFNDCDIYAAMIRGEKYACPGATGPIISLAGNPVRDLVLAQAMAWGENKAWQVFEAEHQATVQEIGRKCQGKGDDWNDFLAYLGGYDMKGQETLCRKSRLDSYSGISGLRKWIAKTYFRFLNEMREQAKSPKAGKNPVSLSDYDEVFHGEVLRLSEAEREEFHGFFTESLRDSLLVLSRKQRHLLLFLYLFDVSSRQAAQVFGVHEGTISRWRADAIDTIRVGLFARFEQRYGRGDRDDFQNILSETQALSAKIVFDSLLAVLDQLHEEGGEQES